MLSKILPYNFLNKAHFFWLGFAFLFILNFSSLAQNNGSSVAQQASLILAKDTGQIKIDHLGQIYQLRGNQLSKITAKGEVHFQDNFLGDIHYFDVNNPLRILVYYKESDELLFLDNQLAIISKIDLSSIALYDPACICSAYINGFWVFNKTTQSLEYYNKDLKKEYSSEQLSYKIKNTENVKELKMYGKHIYLNVSGQGIFVFDKFANYIKTIPAPLVENFIVSENGLFFSQNKSLLFYHFLTLETNTIYTGSSHIQLISYLSKQIVIREKGRAKLIDL